VPWHCGQWRRLRQQSGGGHRCLRRRRRDAQTVFGPVIKGEMFDFRGLIMYDVRDGRFATITVAYNSFRNTKVTGEVIERGIPH
jgi:hypothetical protein